MSVDVATLFFCGVSCLEHSSSSLLRVPGDLLMSLSVLKVVSESTAANQIQIFMYEPS